MQNLEWFRGKRVFLTGHTGFKGSWMCHILGTLGAEVTGYALDEPTSPGLFSLSGVSQRIRDVRGDIRDMDALRRAYEDAAPDAVIHLAAQPLVRESYARPRETFETNVMGTVNLLECVRASRSPVSVLNVTTDKVYLNREWVWGYREGDALDGFDPYSNSKSCSELVTHSYVSSFFAGTPGIAVSTARAGNVIGGGDFARDRIIPDCVRAVLAGKPLAVRNPYSVRPYQHVLEPLFAYLRIVAAQAQTGEAAGWYNVGPGEEACVTTGTLADLFVRAWGGGASWENLAESGAVHEAQCLKLDCSLIRSRLGWKPVWDVRRAVEETVRWTRVWCGGGSVSAEMDRETDAYLKEMKG